MPSSLYFSVCVPRYSGHLIWSNYSNSMLAFSRLTQRPLCELEGQTWNNITLLNLEYSNLKLRLRICMGLDKTYWTTTSNSLLLSGDIHNRAGLTMAIWNAFILLSVCACVCVCVCVCVCLKAYCVVLVLNHFYNFKFDEKFFFGEYKRQCLCLIVQHVCALIIDYRRSGLQRWLGLVCRFTVQSILTFFTRRPMSSMNSWRRLRSVCSSLV